MSANGAAASAASIGRATLRSNISSLYVLQVANYLIPLATLPFLIRTLGAATYGQVALAYATTFLMVLFVDAGFNARAARELATLDPVRDRQQAILVYASTQWLKVGQACLMAALLGALLWLVPSMQAHAALYIASFMTVLGSVLYPTWAFQGLEVMHYTTLCSVGGRLLATVAIFALVHAPSDAVTAALLQASGTAFSGLLAQPILMRRLGLTMYLPWHKLRQALGTTFFAGRSFAFSEYLSGVMGNAGTLVLGVVSGSESVGIYAAIEKIARATNSLFAPLLAALMPRATRFYAGPQDVAKRTLRKWTLWLLILAIGCSACLAVLAPWVLQIAFGHAWVGQSPLLQVFCLWLALAIIGAVLAQLWLFAPGHGRQYTRQNLLASIVQGLALVPCAWMWGAVGAVTAMIVAELLRVLTIHLLIKRQSAQ